MSEDDPSPWEMIEGGAPNSPIGQSHAKETLSPDKDTSQLPSTAPSIASPSPAPDITTTTATDQQESELSESPTLIAQSSPSHASAPSPSFEIPSSSSLPDTTIDTAAIASSPSPVPSLSTSTLTEAPSEEKLTTEEVTVHAPPDPSTTSTPIPITSISAAITSDSTNAKSKGPPSLGPLPERMDFTVLTQEMIAQRIRKLNYPIPFPIFCSLWPSEDTVLIGGGGGRAGTGVGSGVVVCKINKGEVVKSTPLFNNGFSVEPQAEINSQDYLIYQMALHPSRKEFVGAVGGRVYRFAIDGANISSLNYAQTDFHVETTEQFTSCVRFNMTGSQLATGGEDKSVRLWSYPKFELMGTLGSHAASLSSLDFSMDGSKLVSTAGSKLQPGMRIWAIDRLNPSKHASNEEAMVKEARHKLGNTDMEFRSCRWAMEEGKKECIVAALNATPRGPGYVAKFDAQTYELVKLLKVDANPLGNLETSRDRDFFALANNEGTLWIYDVTTMKCVNKQAKCHDLPCTNLVWSPDGSIVCSVSADKSVTFVPKFGNGRPNWLVVLAIVVLLFLCWWLFSQLA